MEAAKAEELRKLQRDRRVLEQQSRALLKLPTKREKEEIQALEASGVPCKSQATDGLMSTLAGGGLQWLAAGQQAPLQLGGICMLPHHVMCGWACVAYTRFPVP